ncbi:MAG: hypothetical protein ACYC6M_13240, partial [Terriglobales bacterium]
EFFLAGKILKITAKENWRPKTLASSAELPIVGPLADVLRTWIHRCGSDWLFPGKRLLGPWTGGMPGTKAIDCVKAAGERAGVPGLTILSIRKTVGTNAKRWGLSPLELQALLRHTNLETQKFYDEKDVEILRPGVEKIQYRVVNSS